MNINRHNYEEYFLLYVDHELTAAERMMVEEFVAANPDLKAELELLAQTTYAADAQLDNDFKAQLLKPVEQEITEEQLLLFVDDELTASEMAHVQEAVVADAGLQKQLQWLQRSKLSTDSSIVFPDKSLLYKETQPARVFYMGASVRRWSAAAAVVLMLGTGFWLMNKQNKVESVAVQQPAVTKPAIKGETVTAPVEETQQPVQSSVIANNNTVAETKNTVENKLPIVSAKEQTPQAALVKNQAVNNTSKPQVPLPVQQYSNIDQETVAINETTTEKNPDNTSNNLTTSSVPQVTNTTQPQATYAAYTNDDEEGDDDNGLLNEERQRSSGLKGFIKKARRTLERRTGIKTGDSQVRFAVFAVNTQ